MPHFTYSANLDRASLQQGDLIERTDKIEAVLKEVHPHYYENEDYKYFIIITQSCDLVQRNDSCNAQYITIAAVRPLELVLKRQIRKIQYNEFDKKLDICNEAQKFKIQQFVERLLNNNESDYFFLYKEPLRRFDNSYCAFLKLSIALKADLHYETLLKAKVLQLDQSFQHKLGYLLGNSYMRVGTEDWVPNNTEEPMFQGMIKKYINKINEVTWLQPEVYKYVTKGLKSENIETVTLETLEELIKAFKEERKKRLEDLSDIIVTEILKDLPIEKKHTDLIKKRVINNPQLKAYVK